MSPSRRSDFSRDPCRLSRLKPLLHERQTENCIALQEGRVGRHSVLHSTISLPPTDGEDSNREKPSRCGFAPPRRCGVCVRTVDGRVSPAYGSVCSLKTREDIPDSHAAGGVRPVWPSPSGMLGQHRLRCGVPPPRHAFHTIATFVARMSQKGRDACVIVSLTYEKAGSVID